MSGNGEKQIKNPLSTPLARSSARLSLLARHHTGSSIRVDVYSMWIAPLASDLWMSCAGKRKREQEKERKRKRERDKENSLSLLSAPQHPSLSSSLRFSSRFSRRPSSCAPLALQRTAVSQQSDQRERERELETRPPHSSHSPPVCKPSAFSLPPPLSDTLHPAHGALPPSPSDPAFGRCCTHPCARSSALPLAFGAVSFLRGCTSSAPLRVLAPKLAPCSLSDELRSKATRTVRTACLRDRGL